MNKPPTELLLSIQAQTGPEQEAQHPSASCLVVLKCLCGMSLGAGSPRTDAVWNPWLALSATGTAECCHSRVLIESQHGRRKSQLCYWLLLSFRGLGLLRAMWRGMDMAPHISPLPSEWGPTPTAVLNKSEQKPSLCREGGECPFTKGGRQRA